MWPLYILSLRVVFFGSNARPGALLWVHAATTFTGRWGYNDQSTVVALLSARFRDTYDVTYAHTRTHTRTSDPAIIKVVLYRPSYT